MVHEFPINANEAWTSRATVIHSGAQITANGFLFNHTYTHCARDNEDVPKSDNFRDK